MKNNSLVVNAPFDVNTIPAGRPSARRHLNRTGAPTQTHNPHRPHTTHLGANPGRNFACKGPVRRRAFGASVARRRAVKNVCNRRGCARMNCQEPVNWKQLSTSRFILTDSLSAARRTAPARPWRECNQLNYEGERE